MLRSALTIQAHAAYAKMHCCRITVVACFEGNDMELQSP